MRSARAASLDAEPRAKGARERSAPERQAQGEEGGILPAGSAIADQIILLVARLRARGVEVGLSEVIDAFEATRHVGLHSRATLRSALRATLVKRGAELDVFDRLFDVLFPPAPRSAVQTAVHELSSPAQTVAGDRDLRALAASLVDEHAGLEGGARGEQHHVRRVLRAADLARLLSEARRLEPGRSAAELRLRVDELRRLIEADVRQRLGAPEPDIAAHVEDFEFLNASRSQLTQMRQAVAPLATKIARRMARHRSSQESGRVNFRRTMRRSLSTGGVPLHICFERPRRHRPELIVLCDISGSVAEFSLFTLTLMTALSSELSRTRSFVFVDGVDEVTTLLEISGHAIEPWQLLRNANVIRSTGHSDYGDVFDEFWDIAAVDLQPTSTTLLVTGDARSNYRTPNVARLHEIARRCRRVYWLNPEPRDDWDTTDSLMSLYGEACTTTFEVRSLRQLRDAVERII